MSQVFISHVSEEVLLASVLKQWVESAFLGQTKVFVSSNDISSGEQWFRRLEDELSSANVLLVLCSTRSVSMPWINFETGAGHIKGIPVIPICHSGMDVDTLPKPLFFLQGLIAEDDDFAFELMKSLAKHLGFPKEPRLPYEELAAEVKQTLAEMSEQCNQTDPEEETGYLDHLVLFTEQMETLVRLLGALGTETNAIAIETTTFVGQASSASSNQSQGTPRYMQKLAKKYGSKLNAYASKLENLNQEYARALPTIESSAQYVIKFQSPQSPEDWKSVDELLTTFDTAEGSITEMKTRVVGVREVMNGIPNLQSDVRKAARKVTKQYDILIRNLDGNSELFHRTRATLKSLKLHLTDEQ